MLLNFSPTLKDARHEYRRFVHEGIGGVESPWKKLSGQVVLVTEMFEIDFRCSGCSLQHGE